MGVQEARSAILPVEELGQHHVLVQKLPGMEIWGCCVGPNEEASGARLEPQGTKDEQKAGSVRWTHLLAHSAVYELRHIGRMTRCREDGMSEGHSKRMT